MTKGVEQVNTKKQALHRMLEAIITDKNDDAADALHDYLQTKMHQMITGKTDEEMDAQVSEQTKEQAFSNSGTVMDDDVKGDIKFKNGGKKTLKKFGNASKELDDNIKGNIKFKNGGKQPAKVLEKTPKPDKFDDGRRFAQGTTDS